jgi:HK97 gp10 family phage protein
MAKMLGVGSFNRKLKKLLPEVKAEIRKAIQDGAEAIVQGQKRLAPVDDGDLQMSITWRWGTDPRIKYAVMKFSGGIRNDPELTAIISAGNTRVRYAHIIEFGAQKHVIKPKNTQGSLYIEGKWLAPGRSVDHPGVKATPFFYPVYRAHRKAVRGKISRAINKAAKRVANS